MAANLAEIVIGSLAQQLLLPATTSIGGIQVDTTLEETYEDSLEVTEHPVEAGASITDHSFKRPMELYLSCGWSDSSSSGLLGVVGLETFAASGSAALAGLVGGAAGLSTLLNPGANTSGSFSGGAMAASDYVAGIYSQLLAKQESREALSVTTGLRTYDSMLIVSLRVRRDQRTRYVLRCEAALRQVILVTTQSATLAPQSAQAFPASTADLVNAGVQQIKSAPQVAPLVQGITGP